MRVSHDTVNKPQRRRAFGDFLGVHDGLGLELDVDRAAAGQVGRRDAEPAVLVDRELDADRALAGRRSGRLSEATPTSWQSSGSGLSRSPAMTRMSTAA